MKHESKNAYTLDSYDVASALRAYVRAASGVDIPDDAEVTICGANGFIVADDSLSATVEWSEAQSVRAPETYNWREHLPVPGPAKTPPPLNGLKR